MLAKTPVGLDELIHTFGRVQDAPKNLVSFTLPYTLFFLGKPVTKTRCHRLIVDNFVQAFETIRSLGLECDARNYGGIYANRPIRGFSAHPSTHSWGIAIDLEPQKYPLGSTSRFPDPIVQAFEDAGFFYGGNFKSRKDPMHFQFVKNY